MSSDDIAALVAFVDVGDVLTILWAAADQIDCKTTWDRCVTTRKADASLTLERPVSKGRADEFDLPHDAVRYFAVSVTRSIAGAPMVKKFVATDAPPQARTPAQSAAWAAQLRSAEASKAASRQTSRANSPTALRLDEMEVAVVQTHEAHLSRFHDMDSKISSATADARRALSVQGDLSKAVELLMRRVTVLEDAANSPSSVLTTVEGRVASLEKRLGQRDAIINKLVSDVEKSVDAKITAAREAAAREQRSTTAPASISAASLADVLSRVALVEDRVNEIEISDSASRRSNSVDEVDLFDVSTWPASRITRRAVVETLLDELSVVPNSRKKLPQTALDQQRRIADALLADLRQADDFGVSPVENSDLAVRMNRHVFGIMATAGHHGLFKDYTSLMTQYDKATSTDVPTGLKALFLTAVEKSPARRERADDGRRDKPQRSGSARKRSPTTVAPPPPAISPKPQPGGVSRA